MFLATVSKISSERIHGLPGPILNLFQPGPNHWKRTGMGIGPLSPSTRHYDAIRFWVDF